MKTFDDLEVSVDKHEGIRGSAFFDNGYGVVVTMSAFTKGGILGKYELAVVRIPPGKTFSVITNDTPIGEPVGFLSKEDVTKLMQQVSELAPNK